MKRFLSIVVSITMCASLFVFNQPVLRSLADSPSVINMADPNLWGSDTGNYGTSSGGILALPKPAGASWQYRASTFANQQFSATFIQNFDIANSNDYYYYSNSDGNYLRYEFNLADPTKPIGTSLGGGKYNSGYALAFGYNFIELLANYGSTGDLNIIASGIYGNWAEVEPLLIGKTVCISLAKNVSGKNVINFTVNGASVILQFDGVTPLFPFTDNGAAVPNGSGFGVGNRSMTVAVKDPGVINNVTNLNLSTSDFWGSNTNNYGTYANTMLSLPRPVGGVWNYRASNTTDQYVSATFIQGFDLTNYNDFYWYDPSNGDSNCYRYEFNLADPTKPLGANLGGGKYNSGYAVAFGFNYVNILGNYGNSATISVLTSGINSSSWPEIAPLLNGKTICVSYIKSDFGKDSINFTVDGASIFVNAVDWVTPTFPYSVSSPVPAGSGFGIENRSMTATITTPVWGTNTNNYGVYSNSVLSLNRPAGDTWSYRSSVFADQQFNTTFTQDFDLSNYNDLYFYDPANGDGNCFRYEFNLADPTKPLGADLGGGKYNSGYAIAFGFNYLEILADYGDSATPTIISTGIYGVWTEVAPLLKGKTIDITYEKDANGKNTIDFTVNGSSVILSTADGVTPLFPFTDNGAAVPDGSGFGIANRSLTATIASTTITGIAAISQMDFGTFNVSDDNNITNIPLNSSYSEFRSGIDAGSATLTFKNPIGNAITDESTIIGTGATAIVNNRGTITNYAMEIYGDVNGDGAINLSDLVSIRNDLLGVQPLQGAFKVAGELYGENTISLNDLVGLMAYVSNSGSINQDPTGENTPLPQYEKFLQKAQSGQPVNICFLGGSITAGMSASPNTGTNTDGYQYDVTSYYTNTINGSYNCWREQTYQYLKNTYETTPGQFHEYNAAIGGTDSMFGAFRLNDHVLQYKPDVLFIEYNINDNDVATSTQNDPNGETSSLRTLTSIVNRVRAEYPDCAIYMPISTYRKYNKIQPNCDLSAQLAKEFCDSQKIPYLMLSDVFYNGKYNLSFNENRLYYGPASDASADYHLSPIGYTIYAEGVEKSLQSCLTNLSFKFDPAVIGTYQAFPQNPTMIFGENLSGCAAGSSVVNSSDISQLHWICLQHQRLYMPNQNSFTFSFKGTAVGVWYSLNTVNYTADIYVDGVKVGSRSSDNAQQFEVEETDLAPNTTHTLEIRPTGLFSTSSDFAMYIQGVGVDNYSPAI